MALVCLGIIWYQYLDGCSPLGWVPHPISPSGSSGAVILRSGVGSGVSPPGGGHQYVPEGSSGARETAGSGLLHSAIPGREGDGAGDPSSISQR